MELEIGTAEPGDGAALARLSGQLGYGAGPEELAARLAVLAGDPDHRVVVARTGAGDGPGIVGWAAARVTTSLLRGREGLVTALVVDEACRGRGVGGALVRGLEDWARERGARAMRVRARIERERAHAFYARLGYREAKRQAVMERVLAAEDGS